MIARRKIVKRPGDAQPAGDAPDAKPAEFGSNLLRVLRRKHRVCRAFDDEVAVELAGARLNRAVGEKIRAITVIRAELRQRRKRRRQLHHRRRIEGDVGIVLGQRRLVIERLNHDALIVEILAARLE